MHWGDAYYGALYWESVHDLLTPAMSRAEADAVARLLGLGPRDRVLDLACGHGRHAHLLAPRVAALVGVDRAGAYLRRAAAAGGPGETFAALVPRFTRGDVRHLPFAGSAFDAAYSWYSSLFMFDDATNLACLVELARVVRPGGRLLVHHANPLRLAREPHDASRRDLPDGGRVEETSTFDALAGVDRSARRLVRADGSVVAATSELRYYSPAEWKDLSRAAGLRLVKLTTTPRAAEAPAEAIGPDAPDLIALLEKPT